MRAATLTIGVAAFVALFLGGCASLTTGADAASPDAVAESANAVGIAPELVYTTEVDGYDLAPQSVGRGAADGMSATWFNDTTETMLTIRSDHGDLTAESCASTPLWEAPADVVTCTEEDGVWHRSGGGIHEYVAVRGDAVIWVIGTIDTPQGDLREAAEAIRVPSDAELERLFSDLPVVPGEPVERGDLPEDGDGAPTDPGGPGG